MLTCQPLTLRQLKVKHFAHNRNFMTLFEPFGLDISAAIKAKGGRYLEAPVSGSKRPAEAGEVNSCFFTFPESHYCSS